MCVSYEKISFPHENWHSPAMILQLQKFCSDLRKTFYFSPELSFLNHVNHPTVTCNSVGAWKKIKKHKPTLLTNEPPAKRQYSNYLLPFKSRTTVTLCRSIAPTEFKTFSKQLENVLQSHFTGITMRHKEEKRLQVIQI